MAEVHYYDLHGIIRIKVEDGEGSIAHLIDRVLLESKTNDGIFENGSEELTIFVGLLPSPNWKPKAYSVGDDLFYSQENEETIVLESATKSGLHQEDVKCIVKGDLRKPGKTEVYLPHAVMKARTGEDRKLILREARRGKFMKALYILSHGANFSARSACEREAYEISSRILEPFLYYRLPNIGYSLVHASAVSSKGLGVLLFGAPDSGKSTITLELVKQGLDFMGEDLAIVGERGVVLSYPKQFPIEAHYFELFPELVQRLASEMRGVERFSFERLARTKSRNFRDILPRVTIKEIFEKAQIAERSSLDFLVFLKRSQIAKPIVRKVDCAELTRILASQLYREFNAAPWRHTEFIQCPSFAAGTDFVQEEMNHHAHISKILNLATRNAQAYELELPALFKPEFAKKILEIIGIQ